MHLKKYPPARRSADDSQRFSEMRLCPAGGNRNQKRRRNLQPADFRCENFYRVLFRLISRKSQYQKNGAQSRNRTDINGVAIRHLTFRTSAPGWEGGTRTRNNVINSHAPVPIRPLPKNWSGLRDSNAPWELGRLLPRPEEARLVRLDGIEPPTRCM